jgi:hypothetical protein
MRMAALALALAIGLTACAADDEQQQAGVNAPASTTPTAASPGEVPAEFRPACGKPGSRVVTERLSVRIKRRDCDLTGVTIVNQDRAAPVPERGGFANSSGVAVEVDDATGDVTFTAEAEVAEL